MASDLDSSHNVYYDRDVEYGLDNELMLNWYPGRILKKVRPGSVLELGLGHGYSVSIFSKKVKRHFVVEGSGAVISRFREKFPHCKAEIVEALFEDFSTEERFDNIVMGFVLEHVDDPAIIIERYSQMLAPDGKIFITVPNSEALNRRFGREAGLLADIEELSANDVALGHKRYFNLASITALVEKEGLRVVSTEGIFLKSLATSQIEALSLSDDILMAMLKVGIDYPELCVGILMETETA